MDNVKSQKLCSPEKNELYADLYEVEATYDKEELSTMLIVQDNNARGYRVFNSRDDFWEYHGTVPEHLRCFSETIYGESSQSPKIQVDFSSRSEIPRNVIVDILDQILDIMLEEFRASFNDRRDTPKSLKDLVVMEECGRNTLGFWSYSYHIQPVSFYVANHSEAKNFAQNVQLCLPKEIGYSFNPWFLNPIQCVRIIVSTHYKQSLHKKISPLSRSLGTAVDVHRNDLFVNRFSVADHDDNSLVETNKDTEIDCVPPNTSLHGPLHFVGRDQIHGTTNIKDANCVVGFTQPETVNDSHETTNTCHDTDIGQQIVHEKQSAISIPSEDHLTITKNTSSLREHSPEMANILSHNTGNHSKDIIIAPSSFPKENPLRREKILSSNNQDLSVLSTSPSSSTGVTASDVLAEKIGDVITKHIHSCTRATTQRVQEYHSRKKSPTHVSRHGIKRKIKHQDIYGRTIACGGEMVKKFHKRRKVTALDTNDDFMIHLSGQVQENSLQYIRNQRKLTNRRLGVDILGVTHPLEEVNSKVSKINDNCGLSRIIIRDKCNITRSSHIIGCHLWVESCTTTICGNYLVEKLLLNIIRASHPLECMKGIARQCELVLKRYISSIRHKIYPHLDDHLISLITSIEIPRISKLSAMLHRMVSKRLRFTYFSEYYCPWFSLSKD